MAPQALYSLIQADCIVLALSARLASGWCREPKSPFRTERAFDLLHS